MTNKLQAIIAPSILAADFARLGEEVNQVLYASLLDKLSSNLIP
jgi:pentose-5-phosphate-3-epimerase